MSQARKKLPEYLNEFITTQNYSRYTARDQATWRCIMRQGRDIFGKTAHPDYLRGLQETGVPISRIPQVDEMDRLLDQFGWGAVCVEGFIPPAIFLAFQGHRLLPIACDMRTLEHIAYTPAPDIVHEAAGHAPILVDQGYADYLAAYSIYANKAIYSVEDIALYEAIRTLSDIKENPEYGDVDIRKAEAELEVAEAALRGISEAGLLARMNWWTAEYGLVGDMADPKIFGAGLLSSLMEGEDCVSDRVFKIPLSVACTEQSYDITNPQPQLYVARSFQHLLEVLEDFGETMSFKRGGAHGLNQAFEARTVTTTVFDHGLSVSGVLEFYQNYNGTFFLQYGQGCQISRDSQQVEPWGYETLQDPLFQIVGSTDRPCHDINWAPGQKVKIEWLGGVVVNGVVASARKIGSQYLVTWESADIKTPHGNFTCQQWPLILGSSVTSVYGGCGDWSRYQKLQVGKASTTPGSRVQSTKKELKVFEAYQIIRDFREGFRKGNADDFGKIRSVLESEPKEWLLALEIYELRCQKNPIFEEWSLWSKLVESQLEEEHHDPAIGRLIRHGLRIASVLDEGGKGL
ncbi:MAG: aromatic amino acid hydroxylase [Oligoflexales bacterium]